MNSLVEKLDVEYVDNMLKEQHKPKRDDINAVRHKLFELVKRENVVVADFMAAYLYLGKIDYRCSKLTDKTGMFVLSYNPSQQIGRIAQELLEYCKSTENCLQEYIIVEDVPFDPLLLRLKVDFTTIMYIKYCPRDILERITVNDHISGFKIVTKLYLLGQMFRIFSNFTIESVEYASYITRELLNGSNDGSISVLATAYTIAMILYRQSKIPSISIEPEDNTLPSIEQNKLMDVFTKLVTKYPKTILTGAVAVGELTGNKTEEPLLIYSNNYEEYSKLFFEELSQLKPTMVKRQMYGVDLIPAMAIIRVNNNPIAIIMDSSDITITSIKTDLKHNKKPIYYTGYGATLSLYARFAILDTNYLTQTLSNQSLTSKQSLETYRTILDSEHCKRMIAILIKYTKPQYRTIDLECPQDCNDVEMNEQEHKYWSNQRKFVYRYNPFQRQGKNIPSLFFTSDLYSGAIIP